MKWHRKLYVRVTQAANQCRRQLANYSKCDLQIGHYAGENSEAENV